MFDQYTDTLKSTIKIDKAELQLLKQARKHISPADDICKAVIARIDADIKRTQQGLARLQKKLTAVQAEHKKDPEKFADVEEKLRLAQLATSFKAKYITKKRTQNEAERDQKHKRT